MSKRSVAFFCVITGLASMLLTATLANAQNENAETILTRLGSAEAQAANNCRL